MQGSVCRRVAVKLSRVPRSGKTEAKWGGEKGRRLQDGSKARAQLLREGLNRVGCDLTITYTRTVLCPSKYMYHHCRNGFHSNENHSRMTNYTSARNHDCPSPMGERQIPPYTPIIIILLLLNCKFHPKSLIISLNTTIPPLMNFNSHISPRLIRLMEIYIHSSIQERSSF